MKFGPSRRTLVNFCPKCGKTLDAVGQVGDEETHEPTPGDWSVCIGCATVLRFTAELKLRPANKREIKRSPLEVHEALRRIYLLRQ